MDQKVKENLEYIKQHVDYLLKENTVRTEREIKEVLGCISFLAGTTIKDMDKQPVKGR